ncbi:hypothetical protein [Chryseobacterium paridis]|uniref:Uncharacterized protein n=1 Tax=Chryseobacterium paridis TaxID=2800328 RepID=A0ABS1FV13_9FLAO|nr:hypothetical protein [Chryseobacterium paridis]MBK1896059.1 hypothetical protein [Chryseobacterium paridis]
MVHLTLRSVEQCIMAAYNQYLTGRDGIITCPTIDNGKVTIQTMIRASQFDCGFAGNQMSKADKDNLKQWCSRNPGGGWAFGFRDTDSSHPDNVNITLINKTNLMFNFHVYLY